MLFLQHVLDSLATGGSCGMVLDEGLLFRASQLINGLNRKCERMTELTSVECVSLGKLA